jgi:hypothetical protein
MKSNLIQSNGPMSISRYKNAMMLSTDGEDDLNNKIFESAQYAQNDSTCQSQVADGLILALQNH